MSVIFFFFIRSYIVIVILYYRINIYSHSRRRFVIFCNYSEVKRATRRGGTRLQDTVFFLCIIHDDNADVVRGKRKSSIFLKCIRHKRRKVCELGNGY